MKAIPMVEKKNDPFLQVDLVRLNLFMVHNLWERENERKRVVCSPYCNDIEGFGRELSAFCISSCILNSRLRLFHACG